MDIIIYSTLSYMGLQLISIQPKFHLYISRELNYIHGYCISLGPAGMLQVQVSKHFWACSCWDDHLSVECEKYTVE